MLISKLRLSQNTTNRITIDEFRTVKIKLFVEFIMI